MLVCGFEYDIESVGVRQNEVNGAAPVLIRHG